MARRFRPNNWWQVGLIWVAAMLAIYLVKDASNGVLTLGRAATEIVAWGLGGLLFGLLLTGLFSLIVRKNLFRGFREHRGER